MAYADELWAAVRAGRMNASAVEGVMRSFLEQPAYSDYRVGLLRLALKRSGEQPS